MKSEYPYKYLDSLINGIHKYKLGPCLDAMELALLVFEEYKELGMPVAKERIVARLCPASCDPEPLNKFYLGTLLQASIENVTQKFKVENFGSLIDDIASFYLSERDSETVIAKQLLVSDKFRNSMTLVRDMSKYFKRVEVQIAALGALISHFPHVVYSIWSEQETMLGWMELRYHEKYKVAIPAKDIMEFSIKKMDVFASILLTRPQIYNCAHNFIKKAANDFTGIIESGESTQQKKVIISKKSVDSVDGYFTHTKDLNCSGIDTCITKGGLINPGKRTLSSMENVKFYPSFEDMYIECIEYGKGLVLHEHPVKTNTEPWEPHKELHVIDSIWCDLYSSHFNDWLRQAKGWSGEEEEYKRQLNNVVFREFLNLHKDGVLFKNITIDPEQAARERWNPDEEKSSENKTQEEMEDYTQITHREVIFAHNLYKAKDDHVPFKTGDDWLKERGGKAKNKFYSTVENHPSYSKPNAKELKTICKLLEGLPMQTYAINDLYNQYGIEYKKVTR